jgi:hypothetical protein
MIEKESYAIFADNSGSVGGCITYWSTIDDILKQYGQDIDHFYFWNSHCYPSSKKEFEAAILARRGTGGTSPEGAAT